MRRVNLTAAFAAAMCMSCMSAGVFATNIEWIGGGTAGAPVDWDLGVNFRNVDTSTDGTADQILGRSNGWRHRDSFVENASLVIGNGANIVYDGNFLGDWHWSSRRTANYGSGDTLAYDATAGNVTIQDGAVLDIQSGPGGDSNGIWSQFDGNELKITGEGSTLKRTREPDNANLPFTAGAFVFGSWRSRDFGDATETFGPTIKLTVEDRGTLSNDGSINFGADGDNPVDLRGVITVGEGANILLFNGPTPDFPIDDAPNNPPKPDGFEGNLNFVYGYEDGALKGEDYKINFTGHGGAIAIDGTGIWIQEETGVTDSVGRRYAATQVAWEDLYTGVTTLNPDHPDNGGSGSPLPAMLPTKQILQSNGSNTAVFGDVFSVTGEFDQNNYRIASITGAGEGGAFRSDINGDLFVDGADAGILLNNLGATGADAVLANGDILDDDVIDGADVGRMINDFDTAYDGHEGSSSASAVYNKNTGEVTVSVQNVSNWYVEALQAGVGAMTGPDDAASVLPIGAGNFAGNNRRVGQFDFGGSMTYDVSLGAVAATDLGESDVSIWFNGGGGGAQALQRGGVEIIPEPVSVALIGLAMFGLAATTRRRTVA